MDESVVWNVVYYWSTALVATAQVLGGSGQKRGYYGETCLIKPSLRNDGPLGIEGTL